MDKNKVTLPPAAAQVIERYRSEGFSNATILQRYFDGGIDESDAAILAVDAEVLMSALVSGYTDTDSPENEIRQYLADIKRLADDAHSNADHEAESEYLAEFNGAFVVLNILGIKIEGVNV